MGKRIFTAFGQNEQVAEYWRYRRHEPGTTVELCLCINARTATCERIAGFRGVISIMLVALAVLITSGCATVPIPGAKTDLLTFLQEGQTTREQVIVTLGQPSGAFNQEKILTYRVGHDAGQGYFIVSPRQIQPGGSWQFVRYSLVLIFDDGGVLLMHRLVEVQ